MTSTLFQAVVNIRPSHHSSVGGTWILRSLGEEWKVYRQTYFEKEGLEMKKIVNCDPLQSRQTMHAILIDVARVTAVILTSIFLTGLLYIVPVQGATTTEKPDSKVLTLANNIKQLSSSDKAALVSAILGEDLSKQSTTVPVVTLPKGPYTSLIIDARDLGMDRCMSPKIYKSDGSEVWGTLSKTPDFVIDTGIASFVSGLDEAQKCKRCGSNPLVVKATGVSTLSAIKYPVVSDSDAALIHDENLKSKFADNCNVIFVIGK